VGLIRNGVIERILPLLAASNRLRVELQRIRLDTQTLS
jgi:hypothetical protein